MKNRIALIFIILLAITIIPAKAQFKLEGTILNLPSSKQLFIYSFFGQQLSKFDSTSVKSGAFTFVFKTDIPRGFYRLGTDKKQSINLVLGSESITINGDFHDIANTLDIEGSKENDLFSDFQAVNRNTYKSLSEFQKLKNEGKISVAMFEVKRDSIIKLQQGYYQSLALENDGTFMAKVGATLTNTEKKNYWSSVDFNDDELLRGDMLVSRVFDYFRKHVPQDIDSWLREYKQLINKTTPKSPQRELVYISLAQLFHSVAPTEAKEVAVAFNREYPESQTSIMMLKNMPVSAPTVGDIAPNIVLQTSDGKTKELNSLKGSVVLLDFWASWCGPCRRENPNVVRAYHKYKDKGFTIFGVSLDRSKEKWLAAIKKDGLDWHHVSDLKGWKSEGAAIYKVRGIPATFLIDREGRIIGKNLRGKALHSKLSEELN